MAKIEAFKSVHYNPEIIEDISKVLCPPYDVIDQRQQEEFYQSHSYNLIRLILGKELSGDKEGQNKYTRAAGYLEEWLRRGVLVQDDKPSIFFYEQDFDADGKKMKRFGIMAVLKTDEDGQKRTVHPHEHTHLAPKQDRFKLLCNVEANLSPIFTIFSDQKKYIKKIFEEDVKKNKPLFDVVDKAGIVNKLWKVDREELIGKIKDFLDEREIFIADGHHRYEVSKMFRDHQRSANPSAFKDSYNYILAYLTPLEDKGLYIMPTHRLIKKTNISIDDLKRSFSVTEVESADKLVDLLSSHSKDCGVFGLYKDSKFYFLKLSDKKECARFINEGPKEYKNLDVVILQKIIFDYLLKIGLDEIGYEVALDKAVKIVDNKDATAVFILNPTKIEQIRSIALGGEVMPQKSTYFYPKLLSGLLIHKF